jgi:hypothetical protein
MVRGRPISEPVILVSGRRFGLALLVEPPHALYLCAAHDVRAVCGDARLPACVTLHFPLWDGYGVCAPNNRLDGEYRRYACAQQRRPSCAWPAFLRTLNRLLRMFGRVRLQQAKLEPRPLSAPAYSVFESSRETTH